MTQEIEFKCFNCSRQLDDEFIFCPSCGHKKQFKYMKIFDQVKTESNDESVSLIKLLDKKIKDIDGYINFYEKESEYTFDIRKIIFEDGTILTVGHKKDSIMSSIYQMTFKGDKKYCNEYNQYLLENIYKTIHS